MIFKNLTNKLTTLLDDFFLELRDIMDSKYSNILDIKKKNSKLYSFDFMEIWQKPLEEILIEKKETHLIVSHDDNVISLIEHNKKIMGQVFLAKL